MFIQAGSGGLGTVAIQFAKHLGATVAPTTSTRNIAWVKDLGADIVIDYKTQDFEAVLNNYDVVLDTTRRRGARKVTSRGQTRRETHLGCRPARTRSCPATSDELRSQVGDTAAQLARQTKAKSRGVTYSFLFMKANGSELREIRTLFDSGVIRPVLIESFHSSRPLKHSPTSGTSRPKAKWS